MLAGAALAAILLASPAGASQTASHRKPAPNSVGIRIMDVPVSEAHDPRASAYIIDHLNPGTTIHRRLQLSSTSPTTQKVTLYAGAATIVKNSFTVAAGTTGNDLTSWMKVSPATVSLAPRSKKIVNVTVVVPKMASEGERYGVVWAQLSHLNANGITEINRVGIRLYLDIGPGGAPPTEFTVTGLAAGPRSGTWPTVTANVTDTGQRALDLTGAMTLSNADGSVKAGPFQVQGGITLLPGHVAPVTVVINRALPTGTWNADLKVTADTTTREVKGTVVLGPANTIKTVKEAQSTSVLPTVLLIAAVVLLLGVIAYLLIRRRSRPVHTETVSES